MPEVRVSRFRERATAAAIAGTNFRCRPLPGARRARPAAASPRPARCDLGSDHRCAGCRRICRCSAARPGDDGQPLITTPSRPRAPLGVRRATPEIPRARVRDAADLPEETLFETPPAAPARAAADGSAIRPASGGRHRGGACAPHRWRRCSMARCCSALDAAVLYFTLRLCGLTPAEIFELPTFPLLAFFLLLTADISSRSRPSAGNRSARWRWASRWSATKTAPCRSAAPRFARWPTLRRRLPLGAGFLPGVLGADRLALHDRLAHTRVVRPSVDPRDQLMRRLAVFVCSFGYIGFFPVAPGTVGSAAGVVLYLLCRRLGAACISSFRSSSALFVAGRLAGAAAEKALGCVDPGPVVIDEVMGMLITLVSDPGRLEGIAARVRAVPRARRRASRFRRGGSNACPAALA